MPDTGLFKAFGLKAYVVSVMVSVVDEKIGVQKGGLECKRSHN